MAMIFWVSAKFGGDDLRRQLEQTLCIAGRPARLLLFVSGQLRRDLARHLYFGQKERTPAGHLRAIAQVEVFGQRVGGPATGCLNAAAPPDTASAIKGNQPTAAITRRLLDDKVRVNREHLGAG